jgi:hypothetical protein
MFRCPVLQEYNMGNGAGNAAWKAAAIANQILPGYKNRRRCVARKRGTDIQCGQLAMSGVPCCRYHGGKGQTVWRKRREQRNAEEARTRRKIQRRVQEFTA